MAIKILTDSACDLPEELVEQYGIEVIPLLVVLDGKELVAGQDVKPADVYAAIRAGKLPLTSQTPAEFFQAAFEKHAQAGNTCIYIAFSAKMSGTCQTGMMVARQVAEQYPGFDIEVIDTRCGSLGQGLVVLEAAKMARAGKGKEEIVAMVKHQSRHMEHIFTVDDLNHLHRGGRLSKASAFIGDLLNIKPILHVKEGVMVPIEKIRGKNKAIRRLVEIMEQRCADISQTIAISHADDLEVARKLMDLVREKLGYKDYIVNVVGSVLGCHIGLGGVGVFFLSNTPQGEVT